MLYVGFELTIPASERTKTVHASDRSATVTSLVRIALVKIWQLVERSPSLNGNGAIWMQLTDKADAEKVSSVNIVTARRCLQACYVCMLRYTRSRIEFRQRAGK
jgi:hypothetical protein